MFKPKKIFGKNTITEITFDEEGDAETLVIKDTNGVLLDLRLHKGNIQPAPDEQAAGRKRSK